MRNDFFSISTLTRKLALGIVLIVPVACHSTPEAITHVEIIAAEHYAAPEKTWDDEIDNLHQILSFYSSQRSIDLSVTPISDHSETEPDFEIFRPTPSQSFGDSNDVLREANEKRRMKKNYDSAFNSLDLTQPSHNKTEIIASILAAENRFASYASPNTLPVKNILIILSSGFEQSAAPLAGTNYTDPKTGLNLADEHIVLEKDKIRDGIIGYLKQTAQIVDLKGASVCMIGITSGFHGHIPHKRSQAIHAFWSRYFAESNAELIGYGSGTSSCNLISR
jgi:hypothetical protein